MRRTIAALSVVLVGIGVAGACTPQANPPPEPIIVGSAPVVGGSLLVTPTNWTHTPSSFTYTWLRCADIGGASCVAVGDTSNYHPVEADIGSYIIAKITGVNEYGTGGSIRSGAVGPVTAAP